MSINISELWTCSLRLVNCENDNVATIETGCLLHYSRCTIYVCQYHDFHKVVVDNVQIWMTWEDVGLQADSVHIKKLAGTRILP